MNKSVMKCCICNNENIGQFITINNKKYHLCCIERLQQENKQLKSILKSKPDIEITLQDDKENKFVLIQSERIDMQEKLNKTIERLLNNWNELKKLLNQKYYNGERIDIKDILDKMQELEQGSDSNE
jgi:hypothetical protein